MPEVSDRTLRWYALQVRTNRERTVTTNLIDRGFEAYTPTLREQRKYSGRTRDFQVPCFSGYTFCRLDPMNRLPVLQVPDVYKLLGTGRDPESIPECEIDAIRRAVDSGLLVERCSFLVAGDLVRIATGPLAGLEGTVLRVKNSYRAVLSVSLLRRAVMVELDAADVAASLSARVFGETKSCTN